MDHDTTVHLLVLVESSHDAEVMASGIRNTGYAVRSKHIEDGEDLEQALEQQSWDLLLCAPAVGDFSAAMALDTVQKSGKDLPVLVFGDDLDADTMTELMRAGAAYCISSDSQDYLIAVVEKELKSLHERRSHRECRTALMESEKRNRTLLDSSRDAISYIHEGMHIYANQSYLELFELDADEIESIPVMDLIASEHQKDFKELLRTISQGKIPEKVFDFQAVKQTQEQFKAVMQFSAASVDGEPCTQIVIQLHSDDAELQKELDQLRKQDLLTGLFNRQYFLEELNNAVAAASKAANASTLFYIKPDSFTAIKDTLGMSGSDLVLTDMANILKNTVKTPNAILARFEGTIFTILFPNTSSDSLTATAEQICKVLEGHIFEVEGKTVTTTASIGVCPIVETTSDAKRALTHAESACTTAGEQGNSVHVHTMADEIASLEEDKAWAQRIRLAIKSNQFVLHFQPIVSLHGESGERYDVLLRMLDKDKNLIMPGEFMPAASNAGLSLEIDRWIFKSAAKAILEKKRTGVDVQLFLKLSPESIEDATLLPWVSKLLKAARLRGTNFVFQASEVDALRNIRATKALVNGIKQLHCSFAISGAGEENPDLKYLTHFDVNYIKIDGEHIKELTNGESSQDIVKSVTEVAQAKHIKTIAEHVEDPSCLAVLWQHGVNFIQDHYLQKPEPHLNYDFSDEH